MATITMLKNAESSGLPVQAHANVTRIYTIWNEIDLAEATTAKGSALAQADVIQAVTVPDNTLILGGWVKCVEEMAGTSTDLTLDVGITGGDVDNIVDGWDFDAATEGDVVSSGVNEIVPVVASDTVDILFVTQTGTVTGGKIVVGVILADISNAANDVSRKGVAQPKS